MRKLQKPPAEELRKKKTEPLAEGLQIAVPIGPKGRRVWSKMSDEQIVGLAKRLVASKEIVGRKELRCEDSGLYQVLYKRELINSIGFEEKQRFWEDTSDENIIRLAKKLMEENGITGRKELEEIDSGLYRILMIRKLLDRVGFEKKRRKGRPWTDMSDDEVIEFAEKIIERKKINSKLELKKADHGVYEVLRIRKLIDQIGLKNRQRSWKSRSDEEIIDFTREFMAENGINGRSELKITDSGLYHVLQSRRLLNSAFAHIERKRTDNARDAVIDALEAFAANDNASAEDDVA
ncbi:hypothetical protein KKE92_06190 [Candidatus Micrarchaeota archaeon]|nr:hypothetical protein [Candidatus Micrarchaeota archaeon]MBU1682197.1 hypothetical protein [Candidatus Micrarchaeota archaeon]